MHCSGLPQDFQAARGQWYHVLAARLHTRGRDGPFSRPLMNLAPTRQPRLAAARSGEYEPLQCQPRNRALAGPRSREECGNLLVGQKPVVAILAIASAP